MTDESASARRYGQGVYRRFLRPPWLVGHLVVLIAVLTCLRLGWWQWERAHEMTGSGRNLGYALLWPVFGAAFIYMWFRMLHLELVKDAEVADTGEGDDSPWPDGRDGTGPAGGLDGLTDESEDRSEPRMGGRRLREPPPQGRIVAVSTIDAYDEDDPQLTAYNQALAALAEEDRRRAR